MRGSVPAAGYQLPFLVEAMLAATMGVGIAMAGLMVVRALFLENALNQFYQANHCQG